MIQVTISDGIVSRVAENIGIWLTSIGLDNVLVTTRRIFQVGGAPFLRNSDGDASNARNRWIDPEATEITDIIPFNEFGKLSDLEFHHSSAFDRESQVIHAPELDDMHDTDDLIPMRLVVPSKFRPDARDEHRPRAVREIARLPRQQDRRQRRRRGHRHHRHDRPSRRPAPQGDRQRGQGQADDRGDGRRRHRGGRALGDEQLRDHRAPTPCSPPTSRPSRPAPSPAPPTACRW